MGTIGQPPKKPVTPYQQKPTQQPTMTGNTNIVGQSNAAVGVNYNVGNPANVHSQSTGISGSVYSSTTYSNTNVGNTTYNTGSAAVRPKLNQGVGE